MSKERRLSRIFAKDGKSVTLALDGYLFFQRKQMVLIIR
ncbi:2-amino-3,7-dideoxy-D-threo-hept-6-ulosonate synthase [Klebsiella pneumoniae IS43]|uniref:2-amino-3,7-dideoxy-D-threo-hept-6-ulosonate synthase n=1 Tax=Klebsiella pneumoniae IS43 TaxID=1432552 RepID=W1DI09_KLEPN|nr:2-amino-3,7-dideoxy-D-threo-hept-6-ulosonate synthase [Klebsiella pneumoniae IS43]